MDKGGGMDRTSRISSPDPMGGTRLDAQSTSALTPDSAPRSTPQTGAQQSGRHMPAPTVPAPANRKAERRKRRQAQTAQTGSSSRLTQFILGVVSLIAFLAVIAVIGGGIAYFRLSQGPISMSFLAKPIEQSINRELSGMRLQVQDAVMHMTKESGVEFRLTNVVLSDAAGVPMAVAPVAAIEISGLALMRGQLAASRIDLLGLRLLLLQGPDGALSLQVSELTPGTKAKTVSGFNDPDATAITPPVDRVQDAGQPVLLGRIDIAKALADASQRARQRQDATSFLRAVGLRDTTVIFDRRGRRSVWHVPDFDIGIHHAKNNSIITSKAVISSAHGPWSINLRSRDSDQTQTISLDGQISNLVPRLIASTLPQLALLEVFDMPVNGAAAMQLGTDGKIIGGDITLELSAGKLWLPWLQDLPLQIDAGGLQLHYDNRTRAMTIEPSKLVWGRSFVTLRGAIIPAPPQHGNDVWRFEIHAVDGSLSGEDVGEKTLPINAMTFKGWITPAIGRVQLEQFYLNAGGAEVAVAADVVDMGSNPRARLEGRIGAMSVAAIKVMWPQNFSAEIRTQVLARLQKGRISSGVFKFATNDDKLAKPHTQLALTLKAEQLAVNIAPKLANPSGQPPIMHISRALMRLAGNKLELSIPRAAIKLPGGKKISLKALHVAIPDLSKARPIANVDLHSSGRLRDVVSLARLMGLADLQPKGLTAEQIFGKYKGNVKLQVPLASPVTLADLRPQGHITLRNGRIKMADAQLKVSDIALDAHLSGKAANVTGQLLINGVIAKLNWQRIFGIPADRQPPARITTSLDNSDRAQLGMDINHLISGTIPVIATITPNGAKPPIIHVHANLTKADIGLKSVAWRKPAGQPAILEFNVAKGSTYPIELQNFKLVGENIAIDGWIALDDSYQPAELYFPEFSINVITRLEVQGMKQKGNANIWAIKVKGTTFDGRDFFAGLFDIDSFTSKTGSGKGHNIPGINLTANIDNVIGFGDVSLRKVTVKLRERNDQLTFIQARGMLDGVGPLNIHMAGKKGTKRILWAKTSRAGKAFKMIGLYPNMRKGQATLKVNLDGKGVAETTGQLEVRKFYVLGDAVVSEVLQTADTSRPVIAQKRKRGQQMQRQRFDFDRLSVPFKIGKGQLLMEDSRITGPLIGATVRGTIDFKAKRIHIGGTYAPMSGLGSALCQILPGIGHLLAGPRCEGIVGITFAVKGNLSSPQVLINPLSVLTPGFLRELMAMTSQKPKFKTRKPAKKAKKSRSRRTRASSSRPTSSGTRRRHQNSDATPGELGGSWSAETTKDGKFRRR